MSVKPYKLSIPQSQLDDLRNRIKNTRWPNQIKGASWERGVPISYLKELADYWLNTYDWQKQEAELNKYDQFTTEIDGQLIHFLHVRSKEAEATPLLLSHGWPSSSVEYLKVIDQLTNPQAHGGVAFHVVIPTIPGFGLSSPVEETGWQSVRTAKAYAELMQRLGYEHYGAHGTDIGADILGELGKIDSKHLIGTHYGSDTQTIVLSVAMFMGGGDPSQNPNLSDKQKERVKQIQAEWDDGMGYLKIQSTRPLTIGYGLNDSPIAQLAWQIEKYKAWTNPSDELPEKKVDIDQMLTNISLYWLTGSGATAANYVYENMHAERAWGAPSQVPTGWAVFGAENIARPLLDPDHHLKHWSEFKEGRHFPAMEVPELLVGDIQKFFSEL